ncbi:heparinase II/III domain-containing protein [Arcticibacter svalbardensis]|uniref:heparinase II/III domain-containing protein n=1 Tax=Arcticibacter svalbardensis TaxID=1288027 RepID=UPI00190F94AD|nr:heparinase II/III family protein [Arcticibacter svalbardensis]
MKSKLSVEKEMNDSWLALKTRADQSVEKNKGGDLRELALTYRMTGDKKYAERAKALLIPILKMEAWDGLDDRTPRWNAALKTSHTLEEVSPTYDAIYDMLSASERKYMADRIVKLGINPSLGDWLYEPTRIHSLNSMGHNWWSAIMYQAGTASLAVLNEVPEAKKWADDVMQVSSEWFSFTGSVLENKPSTFDKDGGFYESIGYASYGVSEYLSFRVAYTNKYGNIKMPYDDVLVKTMDWFIQNCYPNSNDLLSVTFGDSSPHSTGARSVEMMISLGFDKESYRWYLAEAKNLKGNNKGKIDALSLIGQPNFKPVPSSPGLPTAALYSDMGWATMRSSWAKDATMLAVKSGFTWNHAHADAGSFILYHNGENLLIDGGNTSYSRPEYSSYYVTSKAHNVMLFDGEAQNPQDQYYAVKNVGHLYNLINGSDFKYLFSDATGPTSQYFLRNYRNFLWIGNVILVVDDVKAYDYGKFEWLLHYADKAEKKGIDIDITEGKANLIVRPLFPETLPNGYPHDFPDKMKLEERIGLKDHEPDVKAPYYAITPAEKYKQTKFINAIILLNENNKPKEGPSLSGMATAKEARENLPQIERLTGSDYIGVKITQNDQTTEVYFNLIADGRLMHRNSHNTINGWETDAYMMALTYPSSDKAPSLNNVKSYFVSNGSYLRKNGTSVLSSLSKVFMYTKADKGTQEVILQGQPIMNVTLKIPKVSQVILNGEKTKPVYSKDGLVLQIGKH